MSFAELLAAALASSKARAAATAATEAARRALAEAEAAESGAGATEAAANKALHDLLATKGTHYNFADDGTVTFFVATDLGPGWVAQHPIPGSVATTAVKPGG